MDLINRVTKHKDKSNKVSIENKVVLNGGLVSLVSYEKKGDAVKEVVFKEFKVSDLKKEYQELDSRKKAIEKLFKEWRVKL